MMGFETNLWLVVLFSIVTLKQQCVVGEPQVPCLFIFGDSLSDSGNNNNLFTNAKVNHLPYGIDFPTGPTGRFTNGRTAADFITQYLGFEHLIPPFANTSGSDIVQGVNYASGAAGIRIETGSHLGENICLEEQIKNHKVIISQISEKLGSEQEAKEHINKCLYYINIGSNDYLNNYFMKTRYPTHRMYTPEQYAGSLAHEYSIQLKELHDLGARKFALFGVGLIGCVPMEIATHGGNGTICVEEENEAANIFNERVKVLVDQFNKDLSDAKFILINSDSIDSSNPQLSGGSGSNDFIKCCKVGITGLCEPNSEPCRDRNIIPFFDAYHPTERFQQITAMSAYRAPVPSMAYPMDISHLVTS
ncbi:PREDICTED: GDSL esterase/lipase At1g29670-like [Lupinus angustifolius]|uniref:GDSL esterase/lipase At1g29670-like n=1 Tax=Lupinus angustifolius TaxID=3871 RepID=UPI00092F2C6D|nr:PREDICTED: GDSL esterase/lipase At1g29670-like [Lupinus angustifolius]